MLADSVIRSIHQDLSLSVRRAFRVANQQRRDDVAALVDLYSGAQKSILDTDIDANYEQANTRKSLKACGVCLNLTKWVIDESSAALRRPPVVRVKVGEKDITDEWSALDKAGEFGVMLRESERYAWLVNDVAIMPAVRETPDGWGIRWDMFTPDRYAIAQNPNIPSLPDAVALYFALGDSEQSGAQSGGYIVWTAENVAVYDSDGKSVTTEWLPEMTTGRTADNPYGFIPVAIMRSTVPLFGEFYGPMASDLGIYNRQLNMLASEMRLTERMQGFGQLVVINPTDDMKDKLAVGQVTPISIKSRQDQPGDAKFIQPGAPLGELQEAKARMIKEIATRYALNGEDFLQGKTTAQSGAAKKIDNERLDARMSEFREISRPIIAEVVRKSLLMAKWWTKRGADFGEFNASAIPDDPSEIEVEIRYSDNRGMRASEDFVLAQQRAEKGLTSWAEIYMDEHPEIGTVEEAQAAIQANQKLNEETRARSPLEDVPLDAGAGAPVEGDDMGNVKQGEAGGAAAAGVVQDTALNGAQVTALFDAIASASTKEIPVDVLQPALEEAFPLMKPANIARMVAAVKKSKPHAPPPTPTPAPFQKAKQSVDEQEQPK